MIVMYITLRLDPLSVLGNRGNNIEILNVKSSLQWNEKVKCYECDIYRSEMKKSRKV